ncbi:hypothetical protein BWK52_1163c [Lacticaseibacillus paracasei]|nr:hypothetical protein BWK52_1163c [Lacticaseibacillus paracasei]
MVLHPAWLHSFMIMPIRLPFQAQTYRRYSKAEQSEGYSV